MSNGSTPSQAFAAQFLATLVAAGASRIFISPGARSQALAIAAGQLAESGKADLHVRLDERSLGFTALGAALASGEPSVVITTSGTAVANLHPAVLEAHHSGVPLILLTADRPHELRGVGANQTTNQVGIFNDAVRLQFDIHAPSADEPLLDRIDEIVRQAMVAATGVQDTQPGPVQINLAFREPLSSLEPNAAQFHPDVVIDFEKPSLEFAILDAQTPTVIIAGADAGPEATELAESFGWPLLAEPSSGARFGDNAVLAYRQVLETRPELRARIGRAIVFGKPTLSRAITKLLFDESVDVVVVRSKTMGHFDVSRRASAFVDEIAVDAEVDFDWLREWQIADNQIRLSAEADGTLGRREVVESIWQATEHADNLVLGASRLIREADVWAPAKPINVFSNRGLAGIDGTVATATGIALATGQQTRVLLGDLTLLHDAGSLAIDPNDGSLNIQLVVVNDHGGSIFESLEMAKTLQPKTFDKLFRTPQNVNLPTLAAAYGWRHIPVDNEDSLRLALAEIGRVLIEIQIK